MSTTRARDDTDWQGTGSYSRAVRRGQFTVVSGTTATGPDCNAMFPDQIYAQTIDCLDRVVTAVQELGGALSDIIRTRIYLAPGATWQDATRAHGERFAQVLPANTTLYVAALIGSGFLVEAEAEAEAMVQP